MHDYTTRREQWRLLWMIFPLGLVIILMGRLRDPQTAQRINSLFSENGEQPPLSPSQALASPPHLPAGAAAEGRYTAASRRLFAGIQPAKLETIADNTYFRNAERPAWFEFLDALRQTSLEQLKAQSTVDVDYVQLIDQPDSYRGRLVTVHGWVRQVTKQKPAENLLGIDQYFRVVIQPAGGGDWPILAYCLELPSSLSASNDPTSYVTVTGVFFKNLSYRWQDGLGLAPVVLARQPELAQREHEVANSAAIHQPADRDRWLADESSEASTAVQPAAGERSDAQSFREVLSLAGWNAERLAQLDNGQPLSDHDRREAVALLRRLKLFDSSGLKEWVDYGLTSHSIMAQPDVYRGQLVRLSGRIISLSRRVLREADAERLEMAEYFECTMRLEQTSGSPITILTSRVPRAWLSADQLDEPASAVALYFKRLGPGDLPTTLWLAKEIAWHPTQPNAPLVSRGASLLGTFGMDVGLLDSIQGRGPIRAAERDAFFQVLCAAGQIGALELARAAEENLPAVVAAWQREQERATEESHRRLAELAARRAREGRYSVAPLFNSPDQQIGQLIVVDGTARRVVRVEVGDLSAGSERSNGAAQLDHYYEMELFTDDSQNHPIVFCFRELPAGFATGGEIHQPVRAAGFFFKDWLYRSRRPAVGGGDGRAGAAHQAQYAPLILGHAPLELVIPTSGRQIGRLLGGIAFLAALIGIWATAAWLARGDRRFHQRRLAASFTLPEGQTLMELDSNTGGEPMK